MSHHRARPLFTPRSRPPAGSRFRPRFHPRPSGWSVGLLAAALAVALAVAGTAAASGAGETVVHPGGGIDFQQVDWEVGNGSQTGSSHGLFSVDFEAVARSTAIRRGYVNVATLEGWVVRNLPLLPDLRCAGLGTLFDLGGEGDVDSLLAVVAVSPRPLQEFAPGPSSAFVYPVGSVTLDAEGRNQASVSFPAPPPPLDPVVFLPGGLITGVVQPGHPSVEQDDNQCGPASVANSLQWLEDEYGIDVPHDHVPGIEGNPANSLVGQLDDAMDRDEGETVSDEDAITGKLTYIDDNDLADDLDVKHWGGDFVSGDRTVGDVTSDDQSEDGLDLFDWILAELEAGEDVELALGYDGGGGHWVDVVAAGRILGVPWIAWVHDGDQGDPGGTDLDDGGFVWSPVVGGRTLGFRNATLDFAMSESPKPELLDLGCLPDDTIVCIDDEPGDRRFQVEVDFATVQGGGASGEGQGIPLAPLGVERGAVFSFFNRGNPEVLVKVLDGCPVNGHYWVFVTAGTNVGMELTVADRRQGQILEVSNPDLQPAQPVQNTAAFACASDLAQ